MNYREAKVCVKENWSFGVNNAIMVMYALGAIVKLDQAPYNEIKRLKGVRAYAAVVPSISGKRWDKQLAEGLHETENQLAQIVPVWQLEGRYAERSFVNTFSQACCYSVMVDITLS